MSTPIENSRRYLSKLTFSPLRVRREGDGQGGNAMARVGMFTSVASFWTAEDIQKALEGREADEVKTFLDHPDSTHREFLRAGAAKVVLPIRPGYEQKVLSLLEYGEIGTLEPEHSFSKVIEQVQAEHAARKAGPEILDAWEECTPTGALDLEVVMRQVIQQ